MGKRWSERPRIRGYQAFSNKTSFCSQDFYKGYITRSSLRGKIRTRGLNFFLSSPRLYEGECFQQDLFPKDTTAGEEFFSSIIFVQVCGVQDTFSNHVCTIFKGKSEGSPNVVNSKV